MTILLTGGTGKTSRRLASLLSATAHTPLLTSRSPAQSPSHPTVHFDWLLPSTYPLPFAHPVAQSHPINAVYLVAPPITEPFEPMRQFIELAREKGVKRFVLLSASSLEAGGPMMGTVHAYLQQLEKEGVGWAVLRPTWFMENFSEMQHLVTIREQGRIYSATGTGKISFVSADDIAAVALSALTDDEPHDTHHVILGPQLLSYDDVASIISSALDRRIKHVQLTEDELVERLKNSGMTCEHAQLLSRLDLQVSKGVEERLNGIVQEITGQKPVRFEEFVERCKEVWMKE